MNNCNKLNISKIQAKHLVFRSSWIPEFPNWIPGYPYKFPIWFPSPIPYRYPQHIYYISETNHAYYVSSKK
uniref:Uncharacterized protein n=1 Tax=Moumouvirus sp. 'Monve' TaxID=1128131 RepID=H2EDM2_9VIRU|nr:hypothetical protein mv_L290 [Moumouvirus Monve]